MLTRIDPQFGGTPEGEEAEAILAACVHCGFCTAACPTYRLLGDERDGPRGRIYLIKAMLEGEPVTERTRSHLDRCLGCRACESACPSGVRYGRLADIARGIVEERAPRPAIERLERKSLRMILPYPARFAPWVGLARRSMPLLPAVLRNKLPPASGTPSWPPVRHRRTMLALGGCVQPVLAPSIDAAAARVLDRLGISLIRVPASGCCGALSYHLGAHEEGLDFMRRNIDAWWPAIEAGAEAVVITASGCGLMVKEYGELLSRDPAYAEKAARVSALARDLGEVVAAEDWTPLAPLAPQRIAFHSPCTLQHGQRLDGVVESLLQRLGFELTPVADAALCCGSAGTYSLLQPELSSRLRDDKLRNLEAGGPEVIATANIGCLLQLASGARRPVRHWVELLDRC
ncbi:MULTISPECIES: glycolate oxidase subunit GlcF [Methylococcus]|jgi:glycolate oxidase iron-sulfur subunit|uniref:glycolate oxidase subunit GlcF n=1 Tax=Methylococcus TaxID=413 RepID=UPI001C52F44C|nr:glycolate oxidase subunit GlcF [Methylococcus capsulatus]QXP90840.1 glycolate oxidase subunit GlcF [Methylococcus capsulatus]QXP92453.1 glycolate oxidase subunit GlcF [Methylococcus capsulatus]